jgi:carbon-monoxide dehydrogenase medium subunit
MGTIGGALCQADPRFDMPALAVGLDATMHVASPTGVRTLPAGDFFRPDGGTVLRQSEILTRVTFPPVERFSGAAFEKFRVRVFDAALVSVACAVRVGDGVPPEVRIAVGGVRPTPFAAVSAAARLAGDPHGSDPAEVGRRAADEVLPAADATTANATYQRQLLPVVVRDAVVRALATTRS